MNPTPPPNRRATVRIPVNFPADLVILQPEMTFTPTTHHAEVVNLSEGGCKLRCPDIGRAEYQGLLQGIRLAKLSIAVADGRRIDVRGAIVWLEYHDARGRQPAYCALGISFAFTPAPLKEEIARLLAKRDEA